MHKVKAVVALSQDAPVTVTTINVPDPGKGEALVKVLTCGVCQTDHHYVTGGVGQDFPYLLGHESAGIVEAVGDDVTNIAPGDLVILNWRAVCGECRACRKGQPQYCFATHNATQKMTLEDGTELTPALGIGSFAEKTLVAAGQCTKITADISPEQYAAIGLLGCGVTAGLGAVLNTGELKRGESVAVIGCGGVGTAADGFLQGCDGAREGRGHHGRGGASLGVALSGFVLGGSHSAFFFVCGALSGGAQHGGCAIWWCVVEMI